MMKWILTRGTEMIELSDYGFAWYMDGQLVRTGLIENAEDGIGDLIEIGFEVAEA